MQLGTGFKKLGDAVEGAITSHAGELNGVKAADSSAAHAGPINPADVPVGGELLPGGIQGAAAGPHAAALPGAGAVRDGIDGKRRVLIFMTDNTGGHLAMARALESDIKKSYPDAVVEIANGYDKTIYEGPAMRKFMRAGVMWERETVPWKLDIAFKRRHIAPAIRAERAFKARVFMPPIDHHVKRFKPDVIVSTHESTTAALDLRRRQGRLNVPVVAALIDAAPHGVWLGGSVDKHLVYNPRDLARLEQVFAARPGEKLRATAARPPVDPRSQQVHDKVKVREQFGLPVDKPVILVSGGSLGTPVPADLPALVAGTDSHIAVATGRNTALFEELKATYPADRLTPIGFTKEMPGLIATSDAVLLNSNGATSYEAMAAGTPVVYNRAVPGWGTASAKALDADGYSTYARTSEDLVEAVRAIERGDAEPQAMAEAAKGLFALNRPSFADEIMSAQLAH